MREPASDYPTSHYERPNQPWVCGLVREGQACPAGPTAGGSCPALAECAPARDGDRWECNRSQLRGGKCNIGPTPEGECGRVLKCHPTRSLREVRGRFVRSCALLSVGAAIIVLSANWRDRVIAPGPLAQQHAQLLERTGVTADCAACHAAAKQNLAGWTASLVVGRESGPSQSELCIKCHAKTISAEFALAAHSVDPSVLEKIKESRTLPRPLPKREGSSIACATCHREHHGARADLAAMDNGACQSCHQQRFESFAADHPDFGNWPYERRTRIAFNHASHRDKHFAEKKQGFDCRTCHVSDSSGTVQLLASYEKSCAACHDEKIATSVARGVPMLVLPTLDVAALRGAGFDIGPWPKRATGDFDGRLPPMMKLLLAGDPEAAQAMAKLGPEFDFQDVNPQDRQQLAACATIASAIKNLVVAMTESPDTIVRDRVQMALGRSVSEGEADMLVVGLSADTLRSAAGAWELGTSKNTGSPSAKPQAAEDANASVKLPRMAFDPAGNWQRDDASLSIRYRPRGHADPVFTMWLQALGETPNLNQNPIAAAMFKELSKPAAAGLCASCHSIEQKPSGRIVINWRAYDRTVEPRGFTKFAHGPHLLLPQLADCTSCHAIESKSNTAAAYTGVHPAEFVRDFVPVSKQQCAECHTAKAAGDACQKCHNYHVESSPLAPREEISFRGAKRLH